MTVILGATYPDIFAAIGVHSGLEYKAATGEQEARRAMAIGGPDPIEQGLLAYQAICNAMHDKARIVPTIVFHGTNDQIVHPVNGHRVVRQWMETNWRVSGGTYIPVFRSRIRRRGRVQDGPNGRSYTVEEWKDTGDKVVQEYWTVDGMGHEWSGGREGMPFSDPKGPNASQEMYRFFLDHPAP
jgi:poly(3-hydroxybutyrate) depolymerase